VGDAIGAVGFRSAIVVGVDVVRRVAVGVVVAAVPVVTVVRGRAVRVAGLRDQVHRPQAAVAGGQQHGGREDEEDVDEAPHRGRV
jgi:hypothetical protein